METTRRLHVKNYRTPISRAVEIVKQTASQVTPVQSSSRSIPRPVQRVTVVQGSKFQVEAGTAFKTFKSFTRAQGTASAAAIVART